MQVYALEMDDFSEEPYSLIGIHSTLEDYKLAYLINRNLNTRFDKATKDLEAENKRLAKSGKQNSQQYKDNAELIALNKSELQKLNVQRKREMRRERTSQSRCGIYCPFL